ncbi:hypothetical protein K3703_004949 [Escherichia coli]|uniref:hypothetical protein n=1 Tax=Escherichia coli TaxID=562 RepID=UPI00197C40C9|nr:hypothetical protein [Escherichia coli]EGK7433750.1 hypothetical protein [Escherichia coli]EHX9233587.1 hypothetical protein [Escherichia coli]EIE5125536.1 hypothetical protein [Escherichia coli]EKH9310147.1 hypothetical protein [Escherichia coli]MCQ0116920.1 hypothetical protein [Escherichia coli]
MTTITRENAEIKSFITGFLSDPAHDNQSSNSLLTNVFRIALASLESEPVASCIIEDGGMCVDGFGEYVGHSLPDGSHDLYTAPPAPVVPEGLVKAVRFYEQVKCENPPAETGAWKDAVDWVLEEASLAVNIGIKGE